MATPIHLFNRAIVGGNSGVGTSMTTLITSISTNLDDACTYCIQAAFTGAPVGSIKLQGSNDPVLLGYTDIEESITAITAPGSYMVNVEFPGYSYVQLVYTPTSGTGVLNAKINAKRR